MPRWRFLDTDRPDDRAIRDRTLAAIDAWWAEFAARAADLDALFSGQSEFDVVAWMDRWLHPVAPDLCWEFGPPIRGDQHRLVITPESHKTLRPLVATLLERAPDIGWEFYPYRLAETYEQAVTNVQARTGGDLTSLRFTAELDETHRLIDLTFTGDPGGPSEPLHAVFIAIEVLLGEQVLDHWIGGVSHEPAIDAPAYEMDALASTVSELIFTIRGSLPDEPIWQAVRREDWGWASLQGQPGEADDYPQMRDVIAATSALPEASITALNRVAFHSGRFCAGGETLCTLKIDGTKALEGLADRGELEEALDAALGNTLGGTFGGATGRRYSYVFLALPDVEAAIGPLRERLRQAGVHTRSWLTFHDDELADEWVGVYADTPPPPTD